MSQGNRVPYIFFGSEPIGPIALKALERNDYLPEVVVTDTKISLEEQLNLVEKHKAGFILVVGFGAILKQPLLDSVCGQVLNIHPSLLPYHRGPAPVVQTILDGDLETGVTLIEIDAKVDHGPIIAQETHPLHGKETPNELYKVLTQKGVSLFMENIDAYLNEELDLTPQDDSEATFTHFIKKEDGLLDMRNDAREIERKVRAFQGWPGTWIDWDGKRLIIHSVHLEQDEIRIDQVQLEGSKQVALRDFLNGQRLKEAEFYDRIRKG